MSNDVETKSLFHDDVYMLIIYIYISLHNPHFMSYKRTYLWGYIEHSFTLKFYN